MQFVVDEIWTTDHTAPQESDESGNVNNVLVPEHITKSHPAIMSNITPQSTTAALAGKVPKESSRQLGSGSASSGLPGTFPETPAIEVPAFSVDPLPSTSGIGNPINLPAGEKVPDPSTLTSNTILSTVRDDPTLEKTEKDEAETAEDTPKTFSIAPIPATSGIGNPIKLKPGEKVPNPSSLTTNTISSTVRDDPSLEQTAKEESAKDKGGAAGDSQKTFGIVPIPATSGIGNPIQLKPGEKVPDPSILTSNTNFSTVHDDRSLARATDDSQQSFSVAPLPATSGIGNPIQSKPGDKLPDPSTITQNTINSAVTLDKDSYERSLGVPQLPNVVTPQKERDAAGRGLFDLPPVSGTMIPESSLPMGLGAYFEQDPGVTIQSAGSNSSTAALAGRVPLEPRSVPKGSEAPNVTIQSGGPNSTTADLAGQVPFEPKHESADKGAGAIIQSVGPSSTTADLAGRVPLEPQSASKGPGGLDVAIESLGPNLTTTVLAGKVPLEPKSGSEHVGASPRQGPDFTIQSVGPNSTTADLAGQVPLEPQSGSGGSSVPGPDVTIQSVGPKSTTAALAGQVPLESRAVPQVVEESQHKAGFPPEASANSEAVKEKAAVEEELESKIPEEPAASEGTGGQTTGGVVGLLTTGSKSLPSRDLPPTIQQSIDQINSGSAISPTVPHVVQESIIESHQTPEAAASKIAVDEKHEVEQELLKKVKTENAVGEPAPSSSAALTEYAPSSTNDPSISTARPATPPSTQAVDKDTRQHRIDSRDISPMSHPIKSSPKQPTISTGVASNTASQLSPSTPKQAPAASSSSKSPSTPTTEKKSKRASGFFGKLKQKFSDRDKKSSS